jgi:hypothetical protein
MTVHGRTCGCDSGECGEQPTRFPISNPSGLPSIAYRVGNFATFRRALLEHLRAEHELDAWRPTATGDLGLQVLDWWAYIADVLTFYNERIANEDYLGTARLDASVTHLVSALGYRPRPGIGAIATLAAIASNPGPLVIPTGTAFASKATPTIESQTFETTTTTTFQQPTSVLGPVPDDLVDPPPVDGPPDSAPPGTADAPPHNQLLARGGVLVKGTPTSIAVNDRLLLTTKTWSSANDPAVVVTVTGLITEKDQHHRKNTRVLLNGTATLPSNALAKDYRLARATRTAHLSTLPTGATVVSASVLVLDAPARYLKAGDALLIELPGAGVGPSPGNGFDLVRLTAYAEVLWYANAPSPANPTVPPSGSTPGIPLMVSNLSVDAHSGANLSAAYGTQASHVAVRAGWTDVGTLLDTPVHTITSLPGSLRLARPPAVGAGVAHKALAEDAHGNGAAINATPTPGTSDVVVAPSDPSQSLPALQAPLRILWDLATATRGATVREEALGSGDATQTHQDFALAKKPVTFLTDAPGRSGDGYSSTIVLRVDDRYWTEVPTLYGRGPSESIFETYNDDDGNTHVRFGDGEKGARLATGAAVVATYRVGSGAAAPPAGALTQILTAVPNLQSVRNPVAPIGGADPEPASDVRRLAPRSVLTFGRAISGDDYATVAAAAPGVARAAAVWEFDPAEQRPIVRVYVGDDAGAVASAKKALRAQADPNRPLLVLPAVPRAAVLRIVLRLDPSYVADDVFAQVTAALTDPEIGLFAPGVLALGEVLYRSRIEEVVCAVPGVLAAHRVRLTWQLGWFFIFFFQLGYGPRFDPGPGGFFTLDAGDLLLSEELEPVE